MEGPPCNTNAANQTEEIRFGNLRLKKPPNVLSVPAIYSNHITRAMRLNVALNFNLN